VIPKKEARLQGLLFYCLKSNKNIKKYENINFAVFNELLIAGFGGGMIRGLVGFIKHQYSYKNVDFNLPYFFSMVFISGAVGIIVAVAINEAGFQIEGVEHISPALALIIGYAGGDFLDNVYKIIAKKVTEE
jgi:hypothetical protein